MSMRLENRRRIQSAQRNNERNGKTAQQPRKSMGKGGEQIATLINEAKETPEKLLVKNDELLSDRREKMAGGPGFYWDDNPEPHALRRKQIKEKHPEVTSLLGYDPMSVYKIVGAIALQLLSLHLLQGCAWYTKVFCCYTLSGTINHAMTLAMHEASHHLCSKIFWHNRVILILANLPMGIPSGASFRRYHMEHHKFQGEEGVDVDLPTDWEGSFFTSSSRKALWMFLQPLFYSIRPLIVAPKQLSRLELINIISSLSFDGLILYFFGIQGLLYLIAGTLLGMGLHPVAGHFIAEHYVSRHGQETYSYYGPLNWLTFMVGYHNEHHDFPFVAGSNLPQLRSMAAEFYDDISHYHSWVKVIYDYIMDPAMSPYSRIKRVTVTNRFIDELRARGGLVK